MKKSEILKAVLNRFETEVIVTGICYVIKTLVPYSAPPADFKNREELLSWISNLLGDHAYYDDYVRERPKKAERIFGGPAPYGSRTAYHEGRMQWLDWMIAIHEEAEAIGEGRKPKTKLIAAKHHYDLRKRYGKS